MGRCWAMTLQVLGLSSALSAAGGDSGAAEAFMRPRWGHIIRKGAGGAVATLTELPGGMPAYAAALAAMIGGIRAHICVKDRDGRYLYANAARLCVAWRHAGGVGRCGACPPLPEARYRAGEWLQPLQSPLPFPRGTSCV